MNIMAQAGLHQHGLFIFKPVLQYKKVRVNSGSKTSGQNFENYAFYSLNMY